MTGESIAAVAMQQGPQAGPILPVCTVFSIWTGSDVEVFDDGFVLDGPQRHRVQLRR